MTKAGEPEAWSFYQVSHVVAAPTQQPCQDLVPSTVIPSTLGCFLLCRGEMETSCPTAQMAYKQEDHGTAGEEDKQGRDDTMVPGSHVSSSCSCLGCGVAPRAEFSQVQSAGPCRATLVTPVT